MNPWPLLLLVSAILVIGFAAAWAWARKLENYSIVDAVWAFAIGLAACIWLCLGHGDPLKRLVAGTLVAAWSLRLGWHLQRRIRRAHPEEDSRYAKLREHWHSRVDTSFFYFFQGQALLALLMALPFFLVAQDTGAWRVWETLGLGLSLIAISGETLADHQMTLFKRANKDSKSVCREGLWRYSRHPNYFFESLIWLGFYLFACGSSGGWTMIHAPAIILFLLLRVTGVPPTEAAALARKGDAYRDYQRTTSAFIPLPPLATPPHDQHR